MSSLKTLRWRLPVVSIQRTRHRAYATMLTLPCEMIMLFSSTLDLEKSSTVKTCEDVLHYELLHKLTESK